MKIDNLDINEKDALTILIAIWDDLGDIEEMDLLSCKYCKKIFKYLDKWLD